MDVALVQVSPPDKHGSFCFSPPPLSLPPTSLSLFLTTHPPTFPNPTGYCSLGTSVDIMRAGVQCAKHVIGHVNARMPRTMGDGLIHISQFYR